MKRLSLALVYALLITVISIGYALQSVTAAHNHVALQRLTSTYLQQPLQPQQTVVSNPRS